MLFSVYNNTRSTVLHYTILYTHRDIILIRYTHINLFNIKHSEIIIVKYYTLVTFTKYFKYLLMLPRKYKFDLCSHCTDPNGIFKILRSLG